MPAASKAGRIDEDNPVRVVDIFVEELDLGELASRLRERN
jgi:hypothetical protein